MKKKNGSLGTKARSLSLHKRPARRRPIHKRLLLHPITGFALLCVGVLVAGATIRGQAVSYDVTATVPAPMLTQPAIIQEPADQAHLTIDTLTVTGTCPSDSYVKLYRGGVFAGVSICAAGNFTIQASLLPGANELKAQAFNLTDQAGPDSPAIVVYYDLPPPAIVPTVVPTELQISNVGAQDYQTGAVRQTGSNPTVSGLAPPFSQITATFYSDPVVCRTKANASGVWSCTLATALPPGSHHVVIEAVTQSGKRLRFPTFQIKVVADVPLQIATDYTYQVLRQRQAYTRELTLSGGQAPYEVLVDWGDGQTSPMARPDSSPFTIEHTYATPDTVEEYAIIVRVTDANGETFVLQLAAAAKGVILVGGTQNIATWFMDELRGWLWIVWPVYIVVVLMAISFWIGEREAYYHLFKRRGGRPKPHAGR